jgi:mannose-6-phosphate isomerase-like protein (cupin superfamily)
MSSRPTPPPLLIRAEEVGSVARGMGVVTHPYIGKWNSTTADMTTGVTVFGPGSAIPLHTHNVSECVLVLEGQALVTIGEDTFEAATGTNTWVPVGMPHCFANPGAGQLRIFWVYGGLHVTRTIWATGETVEHLSEQDRAPGNPKQRRPTTQV